MNGPLENNNNSIISDKTHKTFSTNTTNDNSNSSENNNNSNSFEGCNVIKMDPDNINSYDFLFKVSLVGDSGCGKTSILLRYSCGTYNENTQSTIGVDFKIVSLKIESSVIKLQLWDTCGSERFKSITSSFLKSCSAYILVFDITSAKTFKNLTNWVKMVNSCTKATFYCLVGNKADLEEKRQVSHEEAIKFAEDNNLHYVETSAKTDLRISEVFTHVSRDLYGELKKRKSLTNEDTDDCVGQLGHSKDINLLLTDPSDTEIKKHGCRC